MENDKINEELEQILEKPVDREENNSIETNDVDLNNNEETNKYGGYFHERDSLAENNIVDEVKASFLEYSMSVITSSFSSLSTGSSKICSNSSLILSFSINYTP